MRVSIYTRLLPFALLIFACGCASIKDVSEFRRERIDEYQNKLDERKPLVEGTLSLEQCVGLAMRYNYDVQQASLKKKLSRMDRNMAFAAFLPSADGTASYTQWEFAQSMHGMQMSDRRYKNSAGNITMPLLLPSAYFMFQNSRMGVTVSKIAAHYTRQLVILQTTNAYYQVLITQKQIKTLESQVEAAKQLHERLKGLADNGLATNWQQGEAEFLFTARTASLDIARRKLVADKAALLQVMGMPPFVDIQLEDAKEPVELPRESLEEMVALALQRHPSLGIADQKGVIAENNVRGAIAEFLPVVSAIGTGTWTTDSFVDHAHLVHGTLVASMDIFKGFARWFNYKSAKYRRQAAKLDSESTALSVMLEVVKARNSLLDAESSFAIAEAEHKFIKEKYDDYEAKYKSGLIPIHELLDTQSDLFDAESYLDKAYYMTYLAKVQLDLALGTLEVPGEDPEVTQKYLVTPETEEQK